MPRRSKAWWVIAAWMGGALAVAADYQFVGIYSQAVAGKSYWCQDGELEMAPAESRDAFSTADRAFRSAHANHEPETHLLTPERAAVVFEFVFPMGGFACDRRWYSIAYGGTVAEAEAAMKATAAKSAIKGSPKIVFRWEGGRNASGTFTRTYGALEVSYTSGKPIDGKSTVLVRGANKGARVIRYKIKTAGGAFETIEVQPGTSFNYPFAAATSIEVEVEFAAEPDKGEAGPSNPTQTIKGILRDELLLNTNGSISPTAKSTPTGVRG